MKSDYIITQILLFVLYIPDAVVENNPVISKFVVCSAVNNPEFLLVSLLNDESPLISLLILGLDSLNSGRLVPFFMDPESVFPDTFLNLCNESVISKSLDPLLGRRFGDTPGLFSPMGDEEKGESGLPTEGDT